MPGLRNFRILSLYDRIPNYEWMSISEMKSLLNIPENEYKQFDKDITTLYEYKYLTRMKEPMRHKSKFLYRKETV